MIGTNDVRVFELALPRGRTLRLGPHAGVMGVVNVTPDSFSDGGVTFERPAAVERALRLAAEGAAVVDIGGESTRPGAAAVPPEEELRRVVPVVEAVREQKSELVLSVDTTKACVAREALAAGADIVNDISAFRGDPEMLPLLARAGVPAVAMHMQGTPRTMQRNPSYGDVAAEVAAFLRERCEAAERAGVRGGQLLVDPGIGFGKTVEHNLVLLRRLDLLAALRRPVVVGASRKSFLGALLERGRGEPVPASERLEGTLAVTVWSALAGASLVRVHDVAANVRALRVVEEILAAASSAGEERAGVSSAAAWGLEARA